MSWGREKADDGLANANASVSVNGHDPSVCGDHYAYSSTTSDALNDELHDHPG
jgi:hypothetical protein